MTSKKTIDQQMESIDAQMERLRKQKAVLQRKKRDQEAAKQAAIKTKIADIVLAHVNFECTMLDLDALDAQIAEIADKISACKMKP